MSILQIIVASALVALIAIGTVPRPSYAQVGVKISIKFIVDASGNRPAVGNLNTDAEIRNEVDQGSSILRGTSTEFALNRVEFVDLAGVSQWFSTAATDANRDALRAAAIANPATYLWRTDSLNIYVNGGNGSAISSFPPNNDIILMNQFCGNTPSCIMHEIGHSLNLLHTHQPGGDQCADTLTDDSSWTKDQLSQANFGKLYANLTAGERAQVDLTYNNIMSYHVDEPQRRISPCQMDRMSTQGYTDRNRLYSRIPIYVNSAFSGTHNGSFTNPYQTLQAALDAGGLANRALVLQQGSYTLTQSQIVADVHMLTRSGPSDVSFVPALQIPIYVVAQRDVNSGPPPNDSRGVQRYTLPVDLENSQNPQVRSMVKAAQNDDTSARRVMREASESARSAVRTEDRDAIIAAADARKKQYEDSAVNHLLAAEQHATGNERLAIQLELAQRYKDAGNFGLAVKYYKLVADTTDQKHLKDEALQFAEKYSQELLKQQRQQ